MEIGVPQWGSSDLPLCFVHSWSGNCGQRRLLSWPHSCRQLLTEPLPFRRVCSACGRPLIGTSCRSDGSQLQPSTSNAAPRIWAISD